MAGRFDVATRVLDHAAAVRAEAASELHERLEGE
jgi:hypothetical protein